MSAPDRIEISIDELVLHGFDRRNAAAVAAAVQAELATALAGWKPHRPLARERVDGGALRIPAGASAGSVGGAVAAQIGRSLGGLGRGA